MNTASPVFHVSHSPELALISAHDGNNQILWTYKPLHDPGHFLSSDPIYDQLVQEIAYILELKNARVKTLQAEYDVILISVPDRAILLSKI